jgi:hypothetical protein
MRLQELSILLFSIIAVGSCQSDDDASNDGTSKEKSTYWSAVLLSAVAFLVVGYFLARCCTPRRIIHRYPRISPGVGAGVIAIIFAIAAVSTHDTVRMTIDAGFPGAIVEGKIEFGVYEVKYTATSPFGETSQTESLECKQDDASASLEKRFCFADPSSDCCKSLASKCKSLKAVTTMGVLATAFATIVEPVRVFWLPSIPGVVSVYSSVGAAACYAVAVVILIAFVVGKPYSSEGTFPLNRGETCGYGSVKVGGVGLTTTLSAGFALFVLAFMLSIMQAKMYQVWQKEKEEENNGSGSVNADAKQNNNPSYNAK